MVEMSKAERLRAQRAVLDAELAAEEQRERREARRKASSVHTSTILADDSPSPSKRENALRYSLWTC